jgi:hypothetical protein
MTKFTVRAVLVCVCHICTAICVRRRLKKVNPSLRHDLAWIVCYSNKRELIIISRNSSAKIENKKIYLYKRLYTDGGC